MQALEKIDKRENDLHKIRDGKLRSSKKRLELDEDLKNEAFEKYFSLFHQQTLVNFPETSDDNDASMYRDEDIYVPDVEPNGFFKINHQLPLLYKTSPDEDLDEEEIPDILKRIRSHSLPIINEKQPMHNKENAVLEDSSVEMPSKIKRLSSLGIEEKNDEKKSKRRGRNSQHKYKKEIIVKGPYPIPHDAMNDVSRKSAAVVEKDDSGYEDMLIAPDGFIPNSVVVAIFEEMRKKDEIIIKDNETIPYKPPQLTVAQLLEIKEMNAVDATSSEISFDVSTKPNSDYDEQLRRLLQDTPSTELLSDDEPILPNSPPPDLTKPTVPVQTATEYFASKMPFKTPVVPPEKKISFILDAEKEPIV